MAMPKKSSRTITIAGRQYRWAVSPDSGSMWLVVQKASGEGRRLVVSMNYGDSRDESGALQQTNRMTPGLVRSLISQAVELGWKPDDKSGVDFRLDAWHMDDGHNS